MQEILEKILAEVDADIREFMLADSTELRVMGRPDMIDPYFKNWELVEQPALVTLEWQKLRDRKFFRDYARQRN